MIEISGYSDETVLNLKKSQHGDLYFSIEGKQTHFKVREFASNDGADDIKVCVALVYLLEEIRQRTGQPVNITSGYRTPAHNQKVGGAKNSQHMLGKAADIVVGAHTSAAHALQIGALAESLGAGGVGVYKTFTHVDVRGARALWDNTGLGLLHNNSFIY